MTEAGIDVGLVFSWPGTIAGGRTIPLADFSDLFPTICDFAGVQLPGDREFDGRSLAPFLRGEGPTPREWIFCQYHVRRTVRDTRFKLYSTGEMYDVAADRDETRNMADSRDPVAAEARLRLQAVLDGLPSDHPPPFQLRSQSAFKLESEGLLSPARTAP
jgi:arylsulfatase A